MRRRDTRYDSQGKPRRSSCYLDLADLFARAFRGPYQAEMMRYGPTRPPPLDPTDEAYDGELCDAYDGAILRKLYHDSENPKRHQVLYGWMTCDGTEVEKNESYTPLVWCTHNLPPQVPTAAFLTSHNRMSSYGLRMFSYGKRMKTYECA